MGQPVITAAKDPGFKLDAFAYICERRCFTGANGRDTDFLAHDLSIFLVLFIFLFLFLFLFLFFFRRRRRRRGRRRGIREEDEGGGGGRGGRRGRRRRISLGPLSLSLSFLRRALLKVVRAYGVTHCRGIVFW